MLGPRLSNAMGRDKSRASWQDRLNPILRSSPDKQKGSRKSWCDQDSRPARNKASKRRKIQNPSGSRFVRVRVNILARPVGQGLPIQIRIGLKEWGAINTRNHAIEKPLQISIQLPCAKPLKHLEIFPFLFLPTHLQFG